MIAEVVSVGTELLLGQIVDTDAVYIAKILSSLGINIYHRSTVGDNPGRMREAIAQAVGRADLVLTVGGLGPTMDDLTKEISAEVLGIELIEDVEHAAWLRDMATRRGWAAPPDSFLKQALIPAEGSGIKNPNGTALGALFRKAGKILICLPGPPSELIPMVEESIVPYLSEHTMGERSVIKSRVLRLVGIGESLVEDKIKDLMLSDNPSVAPYVKTGEVHLRITARAAKAADADAKIHKQEQAIRERLEKWIYGVEEETLEQAVVTLLKNTASSLAAAESCSGGLISKRITDVPDASQIFELGIVAYSNASKVALLGVSPASLAEQGAVSSSVAAQMAKGVRTVSGAKIGISVTGIAGPGGGTSEKPVGTVYIGLSTPDGIMTEHNEFLGQRTVIGQRASQVALALVRRYLLYPEDLPFDRPVQESQG